MTLVSKGPLEKSGFNEVLVSLFVGNQPGERISTNEESETPSRRREEREKDGKGQEKGGRGRKEGMKGTRRRREREREEE